MRRAHTAGTRITTGCGHSWKNRRLRYTADELHEATTDCRHCGELLIVIVPDAVPRDAVPAQVHCPLFHPWLAARTDGLWPADGAGTGYVEFTVDHEEK